MPSLPRSFKHLSFSQSMPITQYSQVKPGLGVSIVLKADQRTGRQVQGTVSQLLTRGNHPRGIKVKLTDGRVGRVQQLLPQRSGPPQQTGLPKRNMASNNPWEDAASQNPWSEDTPSNTHTNQNSGSAQPSYQSNPDTSEYQAPSHPPPGRSSENPWQQGRQAPSLPPRQEPGAQSDADQLLEGQGDRAEQIEHMQQYEASAPQSEADRTQAQLEKEFPNIDGALIAAIYSERPGDLAEVREMLQELNSS
ncbi:hypothetical protein PV11_09692 [Exophiala sideris]|uniref:Uncharacterized protein n=1 Tax=Exophiala sideris TaxID=1016849 RepID=A0A0D1VPD3_9EURO|nr:hypothetical protein PV11_09692 [Exophiala sideris]